MACLVCLFRDLTPGGALVVRLDHQGIGWLAGLPSTPGSHVEPAPELVDAQAGQRFEVHEAWPHDPASLGGDGGE